MVSKPDKRERAAQFRARLAGTMQRKALSRSDLARLTGVDRSTIGQILAEGAARMPNAALAADCAQALGVSADWLLGLSDRPEPIGEMIEAALRLSEAERSGADDQVLGWHREAEGYKIRHVPATLPDLLRTDAVRRWEYAAFQGRSPAPGAGTAQAAQDWLAAGLSDYEIALPEHELRAFAAGTGYYDGLGWPERRAQLEHVRDSARTFYPGLRLCLFDARRAFSAPLSVFGPRLAVLYVGRFYLAFRETGRVRAMAQHFDWLVREASVDARDIPGFVDGLIADQDASGRDRQKM
ncbi:helix-turn-helix domain-containing protein [Mangrovicoccus algicola]|uniref:Helix-turn-helix transcriptional regulator n=1 Tax=Mangrovicoccus algicola TaxID=2771008 RepID=A0A8J7CHU6_9RHOB|nr:helix-turn-helix domain-containing protein [Mangrovicoccus algicola]MBE3638700.1 helix-turn-helix transcriptional regulator [Mangrovicoccus algicola]